MEDWGAVRGRLDCWLRGDPIDTDIVYADIRAALERVEECEREHPPEPEYTAWWEAGKPDVTKLRQRVEELEREKAEWHEIAINESAGRREAETNMVPAQIMLALRLSGMPESRTTVGEIAGWLRSQLCEVTK